MKLERVLKGLACRIPCTRHIVCHPRRKVRLRPAGPHRQHRLEIREGCCRFPALKCQRAEPVVRRDVPGLERDRFLQSHSRTIVLTRRNECLGKQELATWLLRGMALTSAGSW